VEFETHIAFTTCLIKAIFNQAKKMPRNSFKLLFRLDKELLNDVEMTYDECYRIYQETTGEPHDASSKQPMQSTEILPNLKPVKVFKDSLSVN